MASLPSQHQILTSLLNETFKSNLQSNSQRKDFDVKMESSFFVDSPASLFQMLNFCKRRKGTRAISGDATGGLCRDASAITIYGCNSVKLRIEQDAVSSSFRPFCYLKAGGERKYTNTLRAVPIVRKNEWFFVNFHSWSLPIERRMTENGLKSFLRVMRRNIYRQIHSFFSAEEWRSALSTSQLLLRSFHYSTTSQFSLRNSRQQQQQQQ